MERILLLSMGFGTGHNETAKVLQSAYQQLTGVHTELVDLLELIPKTFHPLMQNGYYGLLNRFPLFYDFLYGWTHQSKVMRYVSSELIEKMGWTIRKKINQLCYQIRPTKIVTTHPFSLILLPPRWQHLPSIGVVTDYELHPMWLMRIPDVLCLPKKLLSPTQLERLSWRTGSKILETGLPVNSAFYEELPQEQARMRLGLPLDRPVVLVMGGGAGLGPLEDLVAQLTPLTHIHFVVLTGKNEELYHLLNEQYTEEHVQIESYRRDIPLWMSAADLLVTKPGGVTISEAIAKQVPMFLFEAFPGQEEANQEYLIKRGLAVATNPNHIQIQMNHFFSVETHRKKMRKRFDSLRTPSATDDIVRETLKTVNLKFYIL